MVRKLKVKKKEKYKSLKEKEVSFPEVIPTLEPIKDSEKVWDKIKDKKDKSPIFKEIISNYTPKNEEDEGFYDYINELENKSIKLMAQGKYEEAEVLLGEQLANESFHHYAFEMLAYADYILRGKNEKNLWLMKHALEIAEEFYRLDTLDVEILHDMKENLARIKTDKVLLKWWE